MLYEPLQTTQDVTTGRGDSVSYHVNIEKKEVVKHVRSLTGALYFIFYVSTIVIKN